MGRDILKELKNIFRPYFSITQITNTCYIEIFANKDDDVLQIQAFFLLMITYNTPTAYTLHQLLPS